MKTGKLCHTRDAKVDSETDRLCTKMAHYLGRMFDNMVRKNPKRDTEAQADICSMLRTRTPEGHGITSIVANGAAGDYLALIAEDITESQVIMAAILRVIQPVYGPEEAMLEAKALSREQGGGIDA
jgi:hypothetical protein